MDDIEYNNKLETIRKNRVGRPNKWNSVEELQSQIDNYFIECQQLEEPVTITGLCLALNTSRECLINYQEKDEYFDAIQKAKLKCQHYAELQMYKSKNPAGAIFALKNYGWSDKQEIDHTVTQRVITVDMIGSIDD